MAEPLWLGGWRGLLGVPVLVVGAALLIVQLDRDRGIEPLRRLRGEVRAIESRVAGLEQERDRLRARARGLRADPFEVETVARESLGMIRPGERVLRLPEREDD